MDHDDDGETSYNTFVDDVAFEPTYLQALLTAAESLSSSRVWFMSDSQLPIGLPRVLKCVTSGDVGSGVAECDPQSIWNPPKNCRSFVDATSSDSLTNKSNIGILVLLPYRLCTDSIVTPYT